MEVLNMQTKKAKSQKELRGHIIELENRVRASRELCGVEVEDHTLRSVLISMLDPETKRHTTEHQGMSSTFDQLRAAVLRFVNMNGGSEDAMDIGHFHDPAANEQYRSGAARRSGATTSPS